MYAPTSWTEGSIASLYSRFFSPLQYSMSLDTYFKSCSNQIPRKWGEKEGVGGLGMRATVGSDGDGGRGSGGTKEGRRGLGISSRIRTIYDE
jgi:hypothetical protein